jgi:hypothetical protein
MTRTFTTYSLLLLLALGAAKPTTAQSADEAYMSASENRDALVSLLGERRADAAIMALSPAMQAVFYQTAARTTAGSSSHTAAKAAAATQTLDSTIAVYRSPGSQNWVNDYKTVFTYNAQMLATEAREYGWMTSQNNWVYESRTAYVYNNQGLATEMLFYDGSDVLDMKMELFYNAQGLADSVYTYELYDEDLVLWIIQHYRYEGGRLTEIGMLIYDEDEDEWFGDMVIKFGYDGQGRRTTMGIYILMDEEDDDPFLYSLTEYTYTSAGRLQTVTNSVLNFFTFQLEPSDKTEYTYNSSGDLTMSVEYLYIDGAWGEDYKEEYAYHASLLFSDVANPFNVMLQLYYFVDAFPEFNRVVTTVHGFEYTDGSWTEVDRTTFHVSGESTTGTQEVPVAEAVLYPNPASEHITLNWSGTQESLSLEVYHITGSLVMRQEVQPGQRLNVEQLRTGLYLYRLIDGTNTVQAGKLMKR